MPGKKRQRNSRRPRGSPRQAPRQEAKAPEPAQPAPTGPLVAARFGWRNQPAVAALALALLVLASYLPAMLWGGFVWDDRMFILGEPALRDWDGLARIWFAPSEVREPFYRPLTYTTFWLDYQLWGYAPQGYHVLNVLLHAGSVLLLWRILTRLAVPGAWLIAAVFAVHPMHAESVAWAMERKDALSGLFYMACVWAWLPFLAETEGRPRPRNEARRYWLALALFAAGLLAKNMVVTLPAALLILHWWQRGGVTGRDALRLAPFFALTFAFIAFEMRLIAVATPATFDHSLLERLLIAARAIWFYVGKLALPLDLAVIYPRWDVHIGDMVGWLSLAAAAALVAALWFLRDRIGRGPLAGALFYAVTLSPTLGFFDHTYMVTSFVADRYQYLAGLGVSTVLIGTAAVLAAQLSKTWRMAATAGAAAMLLLLGTATWQQAGIYRDQATFFEHVIAHNPEALGAHVNLAQALIDERRYEEAVAAGETAVAQRPGFLHAHVNLAIALDHLGRFEEAEHHFRRAAEIAPAESAPHARLGDLLSRRGQPEAAEQHLRRALELTPGDRQVLRNLAKLLAQDKPQEALALYDRLLALGAQDAATHTARADLLFRLTRYDEAIAAWQRLLPHVPPEAAFALHISMGRAEWAKSNDADATAPHYERALAIDPQHASVLGDLASLRIGQERYQDAQALFQRAIEQAPDSATLHAGKGYALYRLGQAAAAIESLERALTLDPMLQQAHAHLALARESQR